MTPQNSRMTGTPNQPLEQIGQIARWFETAVPEPSERNAHTQLRVHFEEVFETAKTLREAGTTGLARKERGFAADVLSYVQRQIKSGNLEIAFDKVDRVALLDALCDPSVTAVGVAHILGMNIEGALKEFVSSNESRFGEYRQPIFNEQRRIVKGSRYQRPDLTTYTMKGKQDDV